MDGGFIPDEPPAGGAGGSGSGPGPGRTGAGPPGPSSRPAAAGGGSLARAAAAPPTGCDRCAAPVFDPAWAAAFGVALCPGCKSADHLISRKTAKDLYLVTDTDLARLGSVSRANPHGALFAPMKLYLESQVAEAAAARHGREIGAAHEPTPAAVAAALEPARAARLETRLADRARKRGAAERAAAETEARLARARARIEEHAAEVAAVDVKEEFEEEEDGGDGSTASSGSDTSSGVVEVGEDGEPVDSKQKTKTKAPSPPRRQRRRGTGRGGGRVEREII